MLKFSVLYEADGTTPQMDERGQVKKSVEWTADHPGHTDADGCGVLFTGPESSGTVTLADGTSYDVTPEVIEHLPGHAGPLVHHIELQYQALGAVSELDGTPFAHVCSEACGTEAPPAPQG